jgi:hypothetical protein
MSHTFPYRNRIVGSENYSKTKVSRRKRVYILCSVFIVIGIIGSLIMIAGFFNNGGISTLKDERADNNTSILSDPLRMGEVKGKVISHNTLSPIGATVLAYKTSGFSTLFEKNGGYTVKSTISIDSTFNLDLPSGVYNLVIFYHDGTHDAIMNFEVWPNTTRTLLINY